LRTLRSIYYDHAGLQDRCINCGRLTPGTAAALGVVGLAATRDGHAIDARVFPVIAPTEARAEALLSSERRRGSAHSRAFRGGVRIAGPGNGKNPPRPAIDADL